LEAEQPDRFTISKKRRWLSSGILVLGGVVVMMWGTKKWPRENQIHLAIKGECRNVARLEASFLSDGDEEVAGSSWRFSANHCPNQVETRVSLVPGEWRMKIVIEKRDGQRQVLIRRTKLTGGETWVPVILRLATSS
jgi:hypothetical protein